MTTWVKSLRRLVEKTRLKGHDRINRQNRSFLSFRIQTGRRYFYLIRPHVQLQAHQYNLKIMPYPEQLVKPMREELTRIGVVELRDSSAVDESFSNASGKTQLLIINSVCGCAASNARPAVTLSQQSEIQPDEMITVFAGQDLEATARSREYLAGIPPSSPFIALFSSGDPVFVLERRHIEGRSASAIAMDLVKAYETHCGTNGKTKQSSAEESPPSEDQDSVPPTFKSIL